MTTATITAKPRAFSYLRFSTPEQARGDSHRRQSEAAQLYAFKHGLELDETLTFQDLGVSAYRGDNAETGRLGDFLEAVRSGVIPRGSYLLVESLDRVSRLKARKAMRLLEQICEAGITLVTLADGKTYTEEVLDDDPMAFMWAFMVAIRANEESETKGRRLRASWMNKRARASEHILTARAPKWLRTVTEGKGRRFETIEGRANVVRRVFQMAADGTGQNKIVETLNKEGVPAFDGAKMWHKSIISKWLQSAAVIGTYVPHTITHEGRRKVRNPEKPVENYYPRIVSDDLYQAVSSLYAPGRRSAKHTPKGSLSSILAGLARCALCGAAMTRVNKGAKGKGGKPYLVCTAAKAGAGCQYHAVPQDEVEAAVLEASGAFLADVPSPDGSYTSDYEAFERQLIALDNKIENLIALGGHSPSPTIRKSIEAAETERDIAKKKQDEIARVLTSGSEKIVRDHAYKAFDILHAEPLNIVGANTILRRLFDRVVIDWRNATLALHWRHLPEVAMKAHYASVPRPQRVRFQVISGGSGLA